MESYKNQYINAHSHHDSKKNEWTVKNIFAHEFDETQLNSAQYYSIGIHPWHADSDTHKEELSLIEVALKHKNVVAVGECGIDRSVSNTISQQIEIFKQQIEIANQSQKPVIIHCVRAYPELIGIKKELKPETPLVLHGYNANMTQTNQLLEHGFIFSFGDALFNSKSKIPDIFCRIPEDSFLLETDDSDKSIEEVYERAEELRNISHEQLSTLMYKHFSRIYLSKKRPKK